MSWILELYNARNSKGRWAYEVSYPTNRARKHKWALVEHPATPKAVDRYRNCVGDAESHDGSGEDGVERAAGAEEDAAEDNVEGHGQEQCVERELKLGMHFGEEF